MVKLEVQQAPTRKCVHVGRVKASLELLEQQVVAGLACGGKALIDEGRRRRSLLSQFEPMTNYICATGTPRV